MLVHSQQVLKSIERPCAVVDLVGRHRIASKPSVVGRYVAIATSTILLIDLDARSLVTGNHSLNGRGTSSVVVRVKVSMAGRGACSVSGRGLRLV